MIRYIEKGEMRVIKTKNLGYYLYRTFGYAFLLFIVIVSVFPILWVILSSFKSNGAILTSPFALPDTFNFDAYSSVLKQYDLISYFINSLIVSILPTIGSLLIYAMGAYAIAKFRFPGKNRHQMGPDAGVLIRRLGHVHVHTALHLYSSAL